MTTTSHKNLYDIVYGITKKCSCSSKKKKMNEAQVPLCLHGLGYDNKLGIFDQKIWQAHIEKHLGEHPAHRIRTRALEDQESSENLVLELEVEKEGGDIGLKPVGLKNLGATCYLNSLLQCLYMNPALRQAVYDWPVKTDGMHSSNYTSDMVSLMKAMQDAFIHMEFGKQSWYDPSEIIKSLNLDKTMQQDAQEFNKLLMTFLNRIFKSSGSNVIESQFKGSLAYVTSCHGCNRESRRQSSFYELELPIKSKKTIQEALDGLSVAEELCDDNKYYCGKCECKQNASRRLEVLQDGVAPPPILTLQLLRFVFDTKTFRKKKTKQAIEISSRLSLPCKYYKDGKSQTTIEYELVAVVNHIGPSADAGHYTTDIIIIQNDDDGVDQEHRVLASFDDTEVAVKTDVTKDFKSQSAYMLLYRQRLLQPHDQIRVSIPVALQQRVLTSNANFQQRIDDYEETLEKVIIQSQKRRDLVRKFYSLEDERGESKYWIETEWLRAWISGMKKDNSGDDLIFNEPMDMRQYQCPHKKLSPDSVPKLKLVSGSSLSLLNLKDNALAMKDSCCDECISEIESLSNEKAERLLSIKRQFELLDTDVHKYNHNDLSDTTKRAVSSKFLTAHRTKLKAEQRGIDRPDLTVNLKTKALIAANAVTSAGINFDLTCPHNRFIKGNSTALRIVSDELWKALLSEKYSVSQELRPVDTIKECEECLDEATAEENEIEAKRILRDATLKKLKPLFYRKTSSVRISERNEDHDLYLVSHKWLADWRKSISDIDIDPPDIALINAGFKCDLHDHLLLLEENSDVDFITANEWKVLVCNNSSNIPAPIIKRRNAEWNIKVCVPCSKKKKEMELALQRNFTNKLVFVTELNVGEKPPPLAQEAKQCEERIQNQRSTRKSTKRSRASAMMHSIVVSSTDSVLIVKYKLMECIGIEPRYMTLFVNSAELLENDLTLFEVGYKLSGDQLFVRPTTSSSRNSNVIEDEELLYALPQNSIESGFKGSVFHS